jgi:putative membrane protein
MLIPLHIEHQTEITLWSWSFDPPVILGLVGSAAIYLWSTSARQRAHYPGAAPVESWRIAAFFIGLLAFVIALLSPLEPLSDSFLLTGHMLQHLLITIVGPPLMLLGVPPWLWEAIARGSGNLWKLWLLVTRPVPAFLLFNVTFAFVHIPGFYNLALRNQNVHILEHVLLWATAFVAWWCVVAPSRELGAISAPLKGLYLLANTVPGQLVGALITFSGPILYDEYAHASRVWGLSVHTDQEIGGLIMWVGVGTFYFGLAMFVFYRWASAQVAADRAPRRPARAAQPEPPAPRS